MVANCKLESPATSSKKGIQGKECSPASVQKPPWMGWSDHAQHWILFMHMAAATAMRKGTKLKTCVVAPGAVVLYPSSAHCQWHWHAHGLRCSGTAKPRLQETEEQQP